MRKLFKTRPTNVSVRTIENLSIDTPENPAPGIALKFSETGKLPGYKRANYGNQGYLVPVSEYFFPTSVEVSAYLHALAADVHAKRLNPAIRKKILVVSRDQYGFTIHYCERKLTKTEARKLTHDHHRGPYAYPVSTMLYTLMGDGRKG